MKPNILAQIESKYQHAGIAGTVQAGTNFILRYPQERVISMIYDYILNIQTREDILKKSEYFLYSEPEICRIKPPVSYSPIPDEINHVIGVHEFEQPFISFLEGAVINKENGITLSSESEIILESVQARRPKLENHFLNNPNHLYKIIKKQKGFSVEPSRVVGTSTSMITAPFQGNNGGYADWIRKFLPRLQAIEEYASKTDRSPKIILNPDPPEYQLDSLRTMGYGSDQLIFWNPDEDLHVENLVTPMMNTSELICPYFYHRFERETNRYYNSISPKSIKWLRAQAKKRISKQECNITLSDKVLISRRDVNEKRGRQIENYKEVKNRLETNGFDSYELRSLSFADQVMLFSNADQIVGVHGAGLSNLAFASNCCVVEIFGSFIRPTFFMMSEKLDLNYGMIITEEVSTQPDPFTSISVDPDDILQLITDLRG